MHAAMKIQTDSGAKTLIVGLGKTGLSCVRYLRAQGMPVAVTDSRQEPPGLNAVREQMPDVALFLGGFDPHVFDLADRLVVSPGVPLVEPLIQRAIGRGVSVVGDVELFAQAAAAPVIGITGSNGKSTVTSLLGLMAKLAGVRAAVGGNLGEPILDLLDEKAQLYVVELSSFQLETTTSLNARAATILNVSADHMDRYADFDGYVAAKERVFRGAEIAVVNLDDTTVRSLDHGCGAELGFTLGRPVGPKQFGLVPYNGADWLSRGDEQLIAATDVALSGRHNLANALAALALGTAAGLPHAPMIAALRSFRGLEHRSELVLEHLGVRWYNDSKGTNPGATVAALDGLVTDPSAGKAVLIAGGDGKGADFNPLIPAVRRAARAVVLIGRDAPRIESVLSGVTRLEHATDMGQAVELAAGIAESGDCVLLSPACASFDMFDNYQHRGRIFTEAVRKVCA